MSSGDVIDFRSRQKLPQNVPAPAAIASEAHPLMSTPVWIDGNVVVSKLQRGLISVGLVMSRDHRTGEFKIMPIMLARQEETETD